MEVGNSDATVVGHAEEGTTVELEVGMEGLLLEKVNLVGLQEVRCVGEATGLGIGTS